MSIQYDIGIFGGDRRQMYMAESISTKGVSCSNLQLLTGPYSNKKCNQMSTLERTILKNVRFS